MGRGSCYWQLLASKALKMNCVRKIAFLNVYYFVCSCCEMLKLENGRFLRE